MSTSYRLRAALVALALVAGGASSAGACGTADCLRFSDCSDGLTCADGHCVEPPPPETGDGASDTADTGAAAQADSTSTVGPSDAASDIDATAE